MHLYKIAKGLIKTLKGTKYTLDDRERKKRTGLFSRLFKKKQAQKKAGKPNQRRRLLEETKMMTSFFNWIRESVSRVFKPKTVCWKKGKDRTKTFKCKSKLAKLGLKEYILTKTSNTGNDQRRRLLSKVRMDWDDAWASFISSVNSHGDNDGVCRIAGSLSKVQVDAD